MLRLICFAALLAVANAGCKEVCTQSATDGDFVKGYMGKAESAAAALGASIDNVDQAKKAQGKASATAAKASLQAMGSKKAYDESGIFGFFKDDETVKNMDAIKKNAAVSALDSKKAATAGAMADQEKAEKGMAKANKTLRGAAKFAVSSCINACEAAVAAAQKVFAANPSNKFGVSTGLTLAAAGKAA
jgi:hypothetical protein